MTSVARGLPDSSMAWMTLQRGWLRLYELRLNDEVAAATYCFSYDGRCYFYQGAFDDRYQQHSVGMVAMHAQDPQRWFREGPKEGAKYFEPAATRTADGKFINADTLMMDEYCKKCHEDIEAKGCVVSYWATSP